MPFVKPTFLRILIAQCEGIIDIPSLRFITDPPSTFCGGIQPPSAFDYILEDSSSNYLAEDGTPYFTEDA